MILGNLTHQHMQGGPPWKCERIQNTEHRLGPHPKLSKHFKLTRAIAWNSGVSNSAKTQTGWRTSNNKSINIIVKAADNC